MQATRKLSKFLKPYWQWAILAPVMMILEVTMDLLQPRLLQHIIDDGITHGDMSVVVHTGLSSLRLSQPLWAKAAGRQNNAR